MSKLNAKCVSGRALVYAAVVASLALGNVMSAHAEGVSFKDTILPIIKERCISCHGPEKSKGELRLDSLEAINKGGENGPVIVAGKPEESTLYKLTVLPKDDPDIMPAKGDTLTEEQTKAISAWITEGANFGDWKAEAPAPAAQASAQN
jgi:mono/diheme cytochrome c family protein